MSDHVYRIDKFVVPDAARDEFLERIQGIHAILHRCEGFIRDEIFEESGSEGRSGLIILVGWIGTEAMEAAKQRSSPHIRKPVSTREVTWRGLASSQILGSIAR